MADDIFTDDELKAQEPEALVETDEQKAERERDEHGRFKAKEPVEDPAGDEGADEGAEPAKKKGDTVPQGALHAEREKRKASDAERDAAKAENNQLKEILDAIRQMREQVASRKPEDLPAADDPAAIEHLRKRMAEVEQTTTRVTQDRDNELLNQRELQELGGFMHQSETAFRQQKPDYDDAINHVVQSRARELARYGLSLPEIQQTIAQEATDIVRTAVAQNRDPAELGYEIAQDRGYVPKAAENTDTTAADKPNGGGGAQAMLDAIAAAKAQGKSLGSGGGSAPKTLTLEAVAALNEDEFEAIYSTPEGRRMIDGL